MNETVEKDLENLVEVLRASVPELKQIGVFGSYNNGNWNPPKSDVDIFVLTNDERYSSLDAECPTRFIPDNLHRLDLRLKVEKMFPECYRKGFSLSIYSKKDIQTMLSYSEGGRLLAKNLLNGRLIYSNQSS
ncbi:MAG: nucleotidyltransferase domain-containing protein [Nanoarchaeota archaeon]